VGIDSSDATANRIASHLTPAPLQAVDPSISPSSLQLVFLRTANAAPVLITIKARLELLGPRFIPTKVASAAR
jgi:hypothetical protein